MAQPETPGVWTGAVDGSIAHAFVTDLRHTGWMAVTIDVPKDEGSSARLGVGRLGEMRLGGVGNEGDATRLTGSVGTDGLGFVEILFQIVRQNAEAPGLRVTFHSGSESSDSYWVRYTEAENDPSLDLFFEDDSYATAFPPEPDLPSTEKPRSEPPDHPSRWLEPIQVAEYGSVEALIDELQKLLDVAEIDEDQRLRVQGAIDVLRGTHRAAEVGETRRIEILSVVKSVVRLVATQLPVGIVVWDKAIEALGTWYPSVIQIVKGVLAD